MAPPRKMVPEEDPKKIRRRELNRLSAIACRKRKREVLENLQGMIDAQKTLIHMIGCEMQCLMNENTQLKKKVMESSDIDSYVNDLPHTTDLPHTADLNACLFIPPLFYLDSYSE